MNRKHVLALIVFLTAIGVTLPSWVLEAVVGINTASAHQQLSLPDRSVFQSGSAYKLPLVGQTDVEALRPSSVHFSSDRGLCEKSCKRCHCCETGYTLV